MGADGECAWCRAPLHGQIHTGLPANDIEDWEEFSPESDRYCSARCIERRTIHLFNRRKRFAVRGQGIGGLPVGEQEKWPRFTAEVPPELAALLDTIHRKQLGAEAQHASRAGIVRAGLRLYLEAYGRVSEPTREGTAEEFAGELTGERDAG